MTTARKFADASCFDKHSRNPDESLAPPAGYQVVGMHRHGWAAFFDESRFSMRARFRCEIPELMTDDELREIGPVLYGTSSLESCRNMRITHQELCALIHGDDDNPIRRFAIQKLGPELNPAFVNDLVHYIVISVVVVLPYGGFWLGRPGFGGPSWSPWGIHPEVAGETLALHNTPAP